MPALNTNKQTNKTLTATIPVQQFCFFIIFVDTVHWHFCLNLCTHFAHPKCLAVQCSEPKVACKTPFSCRLCTLFKLIPALNLYPESSFMTYKPLLNCDDKLPFRFPYVEKFLHVSPT